MALLQDGNPGALQLYSQKLLLGSVMVVLEVFPI